MNPVSRSACVARWAHERPEERFAGQAKSNVRKVSWLDQDWRLVEDLALSCRALGSTVPGFLLNTGRSRRWETLQYSPQGCPNFTYEVNRTWVDTGDREKIDPLAGTQQDVLRHEEEENPLHKTMMAHHEQQDSGRHLTGTSSHEASVPSRSHAGTGVLVHSVGGLGWARAKVKGLPTFGIPARRECVLPSPHLERPGSRRQWGLQF